MSQVRDWHSCFVLGATDMNICLSSLKFFVVSAAPLRKSGTVFLKYTAACFFKCSSLYPVPSNPRSYPNISEGVVKKLPAFKEPCVHYVPHKTHS
jgi:hypothetical protein